MSPHSTSVHCRTGRYVRFNGAERRESIKADNSGSILSVRWSPICQTWLCVCACNMANQWMLLPWKWLRVIAFLNLHWLLSFVGWDNHRVLSLMLENPFNLYRLKPSCLPSPFSVTNGLELLKDLKLSPASLCVYRPTFSIC